MSEEHHRKLENMYRQAPCNAYWRPTIRISDRACELSMEVRPEFFHAAGAVHGSAGFKLIDDACFFAANSVVEEVFVLTTQVNLYLTRPVTEGVLTAKARLVHASKNLFVAEAVVTDSNGREVARGTGSFMRGKTPLAEIAGYRL